jgi:hypothetical protein
MTGRGRSLVASVMMSKENLLAGGCDQKWFKALGSVLLEFAAMISGDSSYRLGWLVEVLAGLHFNC